MQFSRFFRYENWVVQKMIVRCWQHQEECGQGHRNIQHAGFRICCCVVKVETFSVLIPCK